MSSEASSVVLCPGQGAQAVGMGQTWSEASSAAAAVYEEADAVLGDRLGAPLSTLCFEGPADRLHQTDASQPALFACGVACWRALEAAGAAPRLTAAAGLSLGEYTALCIAGAFSFADGLQAVAERGRLMQAAAEASRGGMVALMGADEPGADAVCATVLEQLPDAVLVPANFNATGQIVLSGSTEGCEAALAVAGDLGFKAKALTVAGAFHSSLMAPAADAMGDVLASVTINPLEIEVWSNVTAAPHDAADPELLRSRLVEQITQPVRWSQLCGALVARDELRYDELAPGKVLRGLMRRIDRNAEVKNHDQPEAIITPS